MATNPHIYVSSVQGTNTGATDTSKATQQTGNITSMTAGDVYDSIDSAIDGCNPSDGDTVYVVSNHNASLDLGGTGMIFNGSGATTGIGLKIISVDNTNIDEYKPGAKETITDTNSEFNFNYNGILAGVSLDTDDNTASFPYTAARAWRLQDLTLTTNTNTCFRATQAGTFVRLINVHIECTSSSIAMQVTGAGNFEMVGGSFSGTAPKLMGANFGVGGSATAVFIGVDMSNITGDLLNQVSVSSEPIMLRLIGCKLHATTAVCTPSSILKITQHRFEMFNSDDSTSDEYHRFYVANGAGLAQNNDSVYVTANDTWYEGSVKSSIQIKTDNLCSKVYPFVYHLPSRYVDLSSSSTDKIIVNLVTDAVLTNTDIAIFMDYPDGTTAVQANTITSGKTVGTGNFGIDPLAAGTTLATSSLGAGDWTGEPTSPNFYKMELDTVGDAGQATLINIRIEVYIDFTTAGDVLYVDPILEVGT